jgi:hypothetical protein
LRGLNANQAPASVNVFTNREDFTIKPKIIFSGSTVANQGWWLAVCFLKCVSISRTDEDLALQALVDPAAFAEFIPALFSKRLSLPPGAKQQRE